MSELTPPDIHHVNAALGWLELGNVEEAVLELGLVSEQLREHPDVLELWWRVHAVKREWEEALVVARRLLQRAPESAIGWINEAYSLHELKRTQEAMDRLLEALKPFPAVPTVLYNLACYACQLGDLKAARRWLERAATLLGREELKRMARTDPDLAPMRDEIEGMG